MRFLFSRLKTNRGDAAIGLAVLTLVLLTIWAFNEHRLLRASTNDLQKAIDGLEAFPTNEMALISAQYQEAISPLPNGSHFLDLGTGFNKDVSFLPDQNYSATSTDGFAYHLETTLQLDPDARLLRRLHGGKVEIVAETSAAGRTLCGKTSLAGQGTLQLCAVKPGNNLTNRCNTRSLCDGLFTCPASLANQSPTPISSTADLLAMTSDNYYVLTQNLTLNTQLLAGRNTELKNVLFDGNGHTIKGVNAQGALFEGLTNSAVFDLNLDTPSVTTGVNSGLAAVIQRTTDTCIDKTNVNNGLVAGRFYDNIGGLVGWARNGKTWIVDSSFSGQLKYSEKQVSSGGTASGGLVASGVGVVARRVKFSGEVQANYLLGGVAGACNDCEITNAVVENATLRPSAATFSQLVVGGLIGQAGGKVTVKSSRVSSTIFATPSSSACVAGAGGLVGYATSVSGIELLDSSFQGNIDMSGVGVVCPAYTGGIAGFLGSMANLTGYTVNPSTDYIRMKNLTVTGNIASSGGAGGILGAGGDVTYGLKPVEMESLRYTGNVSAPCAGGIACGLVGAISGRSLSVNGKIEGALPNNYTKQTIVAAGGFIAASNSPASRWDLDVVETTGSVARVGSTDKSNVESYCGGIWGLAKSTTFSAKRLTSSSKITCEIAGGIAGQLGGNLSLSNLSTTGDIDASLTYSSTTRGIAGGAFGQFSAAGGKVLKTHSSGAVLAKYVAGGFVGAVLSSNSLQIEDSVEHGAISLDPKATGGYLAAFAAQADGVKFTRVLATGRMSGGTSLTLKLVCPMQVGQAGDCRNCKLEWEQTGTLITPPALPPIDVCDSLAQQKVDDYNRQNQKRVPVFVAFVTTTPTVADSFYDKNTTGITSSTFGVGKTTSELKNQQSGYVRWDFANIWSFTTGQYPALRP